jgi:ABC-type multidrug transport system fused ATPase/permease subunit
LQQADASLGRIAALLREVPQLVDGPIDALPAGSLSVDLDGVSFGYDPQQPVLLNVDIHVEAGRVLGVVGRTGSGKTTLTRLLPRFHDPDAGAVRLGGVDVREVRIAALRSRIGVVKQEVHVFQASVRDNLTLFDDSVPERRILAVLDDVGMGEWVRSLENGLDTQLGAGEEGLSAGQQQVLACARVMLLDPDLVILDEASSRLDPATERMVHVALGRLLQGRTGIIVAHRLSTFAYADDILVIEDGEVVEHGPRLELAADPDSHYSSLLRVAAEGVIL